jgi:hypothetical protein
MRRFICLALLAIASPVIAGPHCTDEQPGKWISQPEMRDRIKAMGYQIDVFKITKGNCYEVYGKDKSGKLIEIYFNPVTGAVVKASSI